MNLEKGLLLMFLMQVNILLAQNSLYQFSRIDISQGLSHNSVNCIFKDSRGFFWFGTMSGLNRFDGYNFKTFRHDINNESSIGDDFVARVLEAPDNKLWIYFRAGMNIYDPVTEKFDRHPQVYLNSIQVPDTNITDIKKDAGGNYWFCDTKTGLYKYDPLHHHTSHFFHNPYDTSTLYSDNIRSIAPCMGNGWWIIYSDGVIDKMDMHTNKIVYRNTGIKKLYQQGISEYHLFADDQNDLWAYIGSNNNAGVFYCNSSTGAIRHIVKGNSANSLNNDLVNGIVQDDKGLIWIATDHGGLNLIDKKDFSVRYLLNREDDDKSISQNSLTSIYKDNDGIIWVGTFKKGVNYFHNNILKFSLYRKQLLDPSSLTYNDVNRFIEDEKSNLWIGTNGGGLIYFNRQTGKFKQLLHDPNNSNSLCNNVIVSLCMDHEQKLWIGTYYGGLDCFDGKTFRHYKHNDADSTSIGDDRIWDIIEDADKNLWIGTFAAGLELFNRQNNTFRHYKGGVPNSVVSSYVNALVDGRNEKLWIGTGYGLDMLDKKTGNFTHFGHDNNNVSNSLSNDNTLGLIEDSRGLIWVGTRDGLDVFDPVVKKFRIFRKQDGLPDNVILTIQEDDMHNLWVSTPNGLSNVVISENAPIDKLNVQFKNYDESDGLQGKEFNEKAAYKTREGELIFGGANGFNMFNPRNINIIGKQPAVVLTGLQLFNSDVAIGEKIDGHIILPQSISVSKEIILRYNENVFSIEFASLGFPVKKNVKYSYILEDFNKQWLIADEKTRKATFTNLDPGDYVFKVRTSDGNGKWGTEVAALGIKILPPFWKTPLAYIIYALIAILILIFSRHLILQRAHMRFAIAQERQEAQRMHELDMMKIKFFTNMSHEFRTPLSLILSPLDRIIKNAPEPSQKKQFQLIHRNARRLLNLVNQLLDFRKMEVHELKLNLSTGDIAKFIWEVSCSFTDLAEKKNIRFSYQSSVDSLYTSFDHDKIERILFNLLSNAFKFTPENGKINMEVNETGTGDDCLLQIKINDTGIGIPEEKREKIFERFFQNDLPGSMVNLGSGIGLSITKEFVKLHGGNMEVESEVDKGSTFSVFLPLKKIEKEALPTAAESDENLSEEFVHEFSDETAATADNPANGTDKNRKRTVLLVEDNEDFRFYLKDNLRDSFNILEAADGKQGWQRTLSSHPDLVVSDVSMPVMNGIDLCRKIKSDKRTSLIPVILLTAITGEESHLKGLGTGANDYMGKPFNFEILLSKIKNLLAQQERSRKVYQKQLMAEPSDIQLPSPDEKFLKDALELIEKNMSNDEFSVEEMSRGLFISRVALYKKLLALTGKTPVEFIRCMRMKRAAQLLEKSNLTIAEIAYEVGFNNPKYFSRHFKKEFGALPSEYQNSKKKEMQKEAR
ncbi:MAG TPA: two-component regulator propeller domain-containing protein [Puia sp.]|nr:two-component regulator propeller domain-containing protein [Puia sp.]